MDELDPSKASELGMELCKAHNPPKVMLQNHETKTWKCPESECGHEIPFQEKNS